MPDVRETITDKARRLLAAGRLEVRHVDRYSIAAVCRGDHDTYRLGYTGGWHCDCPAVGRCSHLEALRLVTVCGTPDGGTT